MPSIWQFWIDCPKKMMKNRYSVRFYSKADLDYFVKKFHATKTLIPRSINPNTTLSTYDLGKLLGIKILCIVGRQIAVKLRKLDQRTKTYAMFKINELMFNIEMRGLSEISAMKPTANVTPITFDPTTGQNYARLVPTPPNTNSGFAEEFNF